MSSSKVPLVVTENSSEVQQTLLPEVPPRPHSLHFLTPDPEECGSPDDNAGAGFNKERRGSKSCLKVSSSDFSSDATGGNRSPCLSVGSPARRRSVHFNASPVHSTVEVRLVSLSKSLQINIISLQVTFL